MFDDLLLNSQTFKSLQAFVGRPGHALLISGPAGAGKKHLARNLASTLLGVRIDKLAGHPRLHVIGLPEDKAEIPIESARQLIGALNLKLPEQSTAIARVVIIEDADLLSTEAQNALLKLLEEPPPATQLILTSSRPQNILPTVVSRLRTINVLPATFEQSLGYFKEYAPADIESAWHLSRGAASLLSALLAEGSAHNMKQAVQEAKAVLAQTGYQRIGLIQSAAKDKANFVLLLDALARVLGVLQRTNSQEAAKQLLAARRAVLAAQQSIEHNANLRLTALNLALNIPL